MMDSIIKLIYFDKDNNQFDDIKIDDLLQAPENSSLQNGGLSGLGLGGGLESLLQGDDFNGLLKMFD